MKYLSILFVIVFICSCGRSDVNDITEMPDCITDIIEDDYMSSDLKFIKAQEVDDEFYYWLNTEFVESDGWEYIVNVDCDTVCYLCGFCLPPECTVDYSDDWVTIWEK